MKSLRYQNLVLVPLLLLVIFFVSWHVYVSYRESKALPSPPDNDSPLAPVQVSPPRSSDGAANWSPATFNSYAPDGIRQTSDHSWSAKGGRAFLQARRLDSGSLELRFVYPFDRFVSAESNVLLRVRWFLKPTDPLVAELAITPEQLATLKSIPRWPFSPMARS